MKPVIHVKSGKQGRPRKIVNPAFMREVLSSKRNISQAKLGRALGMHRHTVRKNRIYFDIQYAYSSLTDAELDVLVSNYKANHNESGLKYVRGYLRSEGLRIQKDRVIASLRRLDALGSALRERRSIRRRKYQTQRPNCLWHCDGHHKLIRWGVVIHGFIDGYCRTVSFREYIHQKHKLTIHN